MSPNFSNLELQRLKMLFKNISWVAGYSDPAFVLLSNPDGTYDLCLAEGPKRVATFEGPKRVATFDGSYYAEAALTEVINAVPVLLDEIERLRSKLASISVIAQP